MTAPASDDGFAYDFALLHAPADGEAAQALSAALASLGARAAWLPGQAPAGGALDDQLARSRWVLVLWSAASRGDASLQGRALHALQRHALLPVRLDLGEPPAGLVGVPEASLAGWQGDPDEPILGSLARSVALLLGVLPPFDAVAEALPPDTGVPGLLHGWRRRWQRWFGAAMPQRAPLPEAALRPPAPPLIEAFERTVPLARPTVTPARAALPVWVGVSVPRHAAAGQELQARLGLFVEPLRAAVLAALAGLEPETVPGPVAADASLWRAGAPLAIALHGSDGLQISPPRRQLDWDGASAIVSFNVKVAPGTPLGPQSLHFVLLLAGVPMASVGLALRVERSNMATALAVPVVEPARRLPRSLWLARAEADVPEVARRIAELQHWAPGLRLVGIDESHDGAAAAPALRDCDAALLCWSPAAAASPAVARALGEAWQGLGAEAVLPLPLADPADTAPPAEFAAAPWGERYQAIWLALAPGA